MAPVPVPQLPTLVALHGNHRMHPWKCRGTMQGSAASHFERGKIRVNPNVQRLHHPRRPHRRPHRLRHRSLLHIPSSPLPYLLYRQHLPTFKGPSAVGMLPSRSPPTRPSRSLAHYATGHPRPLHLSVPPECIMHSAALVLLVLRHVPRLPPTRS